METPAQLAGVQCRWTRFVLIHAEEVSPVALQLPPRLRVRLLLPLAMTISMALTGCDFGDLPDSGGIGDWRQLLCGAQRSATADSGLVFRYDLVRDCRFRGEDALLDWDVEPVGFAGENEVDVEFDDELDLELDNRVPVDGLGSARVTNLKRNLSSPYGAMVQCHYASEDFYYAASGAVYIRDQRGQGVPPRFLAYVELTFYDHDDCFGTSIDGGHDSNVVYHPTLVEFWRAVSTGAIEAPEGTRSVKIAAVVDVPSGNPIGQSYEANFDLLSLAVLEEDLAVDPL